MGAVYGISLLVDKTFFTGVVIGGGQTGALVAKLGVHTLLIGLYAAGVFAILRKRS